MYAARRADNTLAAIDAATGKEIWRKQTQGTIGARGMNYWESADRKDRRLLFLAGGHLTAINARDRRADHDVRHQRPRRPARSRWTGSGSNPLQTSNPGRIFENLVHHVAAGAGRAATMPTPPMSMPTTCVTGKLAVGLPRDSAPGRVRLRDVAAGGATRGRAAATTGASSTVDEQRGIAFINFGSPRFDFYGGDRKGDNLFGNSLVAIDARTGRRLWHYQLMHHDLWDYDLPQAPKLLTIRQNGRNIDVVAQATKHGFLFVFDRETGTPIWPIEERKVPQSDVPGEFTSPTQPFPTKPAPFARQSFTEKDINPYLPEASSRRSRERFKYLRNEGLFTPPSFEGSISMPGHNGGANFATSAVDPMRGEIYVVQRRCRRSIASRCRCCRRRRGAAAVAAAVAAVVAAAVARRSSRPSRRPS